MKTMKFAKVTLLGLLSILLALVVVLAAVFFFWLGPAVKLIAENIGSKALGTPVTVNTLAINPREGTLLLEGFTIGNHAGYAHSNTVSLAKLALSIDMDTVFTDTIVVKEILVDGPHFTYEQNSATDNITQFITNVFAYANIDPHAPKKAKPAAKQEKEAETKQLVIEHLRITDVRMTLANSDDPLLDLSVALAEMNLSLTNGVIQLKNLAVSNPGRLATPNLFELDAIEVALDPASIHSGPVAITDLKVVKPYAYLEKNTETDTVAELIKIGNLFSAKAAAKPAVEKTAARAEPAPEPAAPAVELRNLLVDDIQLKLLDATNTNAPAGTQTMASVGSVSVRLLEGTVHIGAITISNLPGGFATTNLLHLAGIDIAVDPATIHSKHIVLNEVRVDSPTINLEQTKTTGNVSEFQKFANSLMPPAAAPAEPADKAPKTAPVALADQPVVLRALVVTNLAINMVFPVDTNSFDSALSFPSLGNLNPLGLLAGTDTNAVEEIPLPDGQLTLMSFVQLTVEPLKGLVRLDNLQVGNPEGFANKNIVQLDHFQLDIDPDTLQSDIMQIRGILIDNPTIAYERQLATDNIKALQAFIAGATTSPEAKGKEKPETVETGNPEPEAAGKKVVIDHLLVNSGKIKAKLSIVPTASIPLPKIEMNGIGKEKGGTSPAQAATEIGEKFYDTIIGAVSGATGFAGDALKGVGNLSLDVLGAATGNTDANPGDRAAAAEKTATEPAAPAETKPKPTRIFHKGSRR